MKSFENILDGTWQEFEAWIKDTIESSFVGVSARQIHALTGR